MSIAFGEIDCHVWEATWCNRRWITGFCLEAMYRHQAGQRQRRKLHEMVLAERLDGQRLRHWLNKCNRRADLATLARAFHEGHSEQHFYGLLLALRVAILAQPRVQRLRAEIAWRAIDVAGEFLNEKQLDGDLGHAIGGVLTGLEANPHQLYPSTRTRFYTTVELLGLDVLAGRLAERA